MAYGRPMKSSTRRTPITVHVPMGMIEIIDGYVAEYAEATGTAYSRSDFYEAAAKMLLESAGIDPESGERNKSVTENRAVEHTEYNINNTRTKVAENAEDKTQR